MQGVGVAGCWPPPRDACTPLRDVNEVPVFPLNSLLVYSDYPAPHSDRPAHAFARNNSPPLSVSLAGTALSAVRLTQTLCCSPVAEEETEAPGH